MTEPAVPKDPAREATRKAGQSFEAAYRRELEEMGAVESTLGAQVLLLCSRMANPAETGASVAALSREARSVMDELRAKKPAADDVDEVKKRRDRIAREAAG